MAPVPYPDRAICWRFAHPDLRALAVDPYLRADTPSPHSSPSFRVGKIHGDDVVLAVLALCREYGGDMDLPGTPRPPPPHRIFPLALLLFSLLFSFLPR
jgi:hypothetical protein